MNSITDKRLLSILVNDDFINYVLNPDLILKERWENHFIIHPDDLPLVHKARQILLGESNPTELSQEEALTMEHNLFKKCGLPFN